MDVVGWRELEAEHLDEETYLLWQRYGLVFACPTAHRNGPKRLNVESISWMFLIHLNSNSEIGYVVTLLIKCQAQKHKSYMNTLLHTGNMLSFSLTYPFTHPPLATRLFGSLLTPCSLLFFGGNIWSFITVFNDMRGGSKKNATIPFGLLAFAYVIIIHIQYN